MRVAWLSQNERAKYKRTLDKSSWLSSLWPCHLYWPWLVRLRATRTAGGLRDPAWGAALSVPLSRLSWSPRSCPAWQGDRNILLLWHENM